MPSTYSTSLKIELIGNGEQSGTWGQTLNNNLGTLIEQAISGVGQIDLTGYSSYELTNFNGLPDEARNAVLVFSGTPSANVVVTAPAVQKVYVVSNQVSGGYPVTIKTSGGNGISILANTKQLVYCDGTNFFTGVSVNSIFGDLTVSGDAIVANTTTISGNITVNNSVISSNTNIALTANSSIVSMLPNTGGFVPPTGTTAQRPSSPKAGTARWNFDIGAYEIWNGLSWENIIAGNYGVTYLIVAGGGGGNTGGGGAGGVLSGTANVAGNTAYAVVVGAGGGSGANGGNSSVFSTVSLGGGHGAAFGVAGGNGGSGGGGWSGISDSQPPGSGTSGQGYAGGNGYFTFPDAYGAGGGGAGAVGQGEQYNTNGGIGIQSSITGTSVYYAGGGVGTSGGSGGAGSIGHGGSGGGGGGNSGAVIISYANPTQRGTGGTVTSYVSGTTKYWVHTFTSSGNFVA